jgi:hypothetical protein
MNWLEFVIIAVVAFVGLALTLATVALCMMLIKWAVRDIANMIVDSIAWSKNAYKKITA